MKPLILDLISSFFLFLTAVFAAADGDINNALVWFILGIIFVRIGLLSQQMEDRS